MIFLSILNRFNINLDVDRNEHRPTRTTQKSLVGLTILEMFLLAWNLVAILENTIYFDDTSYTAFTRIKFTLCCCNVFKTPSSVSGGWHRKLNCSLMFPNYKSNFKVEYIQWILIDENKDLIFFNSNIFTPKPNWSTFQL